MAFFGQGHTALTTGIGLLSVALWRAEFGNQWVAAIGAGLSGLALLATGRFDEAKPLLAAVVGVNVEGLPLDDGGLSTYEEAPLGE